MASPAAPSQDELKLLLELCNGKKTFEQVKEDASRYARRNFGLRRLRHLSRSNASRGISQRLAELTGISGGSLHYARVRCKHDAADQEEGDTMLHPFVRLPQILEGCLDAVPSCFEIEEVAAPTGVISSTFVRSPEYLEHELVRPCQGTAETVVPLCLYSDGIRVNADPHPDSLYVIYLYFPHQAGGAGDNTETKHLFTCYLKSQTTKETLEDIWGVLLWELKALAQGRQAKTSELGKPLATQSAGDHVRGNWGRWHRVCLMQLKGDWAYYQEALGVWQWNAKSFMCPAQGQGTRCWKDFSLDAEWKCTCRTHARFVQDMRLSREQHFQRHRAPFAFEARILAAPFF